jgi:imidazolonepropionase-like amidohydrolase
MTAARLILFLISLLPAAGLVTGNEAADPIALEGGTILTAVGPPIQNGTVLIQGGKIAAVGSNVAIPQGAKIIHVSGKVLTPGLIDIHSHIGMYPYYGDNENVPIGPQHRALDGIQFEHPDWARAVRGGVTTVLTTPGSGSYISGQSMTLKTFGDDTDRRILTTGNIKMAVNAKNLSAVPLIRSELYQAREYLKAWEKYESGNKNGPPPKKDLGLEALARLIKGEVLLHVHIYTANDMLSFLKLKDEFGFDMTFIHSGEAYKIADEIAKRHVNCICYPLVMLPGVTEDQMKGNLVLYKAGVKLAFHTDHEVTQEQWLRICAALSLRYGFPEDEALRAITINPAEMLKIAGRVGSIEKGKDADIVVFDGPWYELASRVEMAFVDGVLAYDRTTEKAKNRVAQE